MSHWQGQFRRRMQQFGAMRKAVPGEAAVSIKIGVSSGCFHREHSPKAYTLIDRYLDALGPEDAGSLSFEEHESGPEILVWIAVTTAGLTLGKSIVDLVTTIIRARSEGVKQGDRPAEPVELIVRRMSSRDEFREETILRIGHRESVNREVIEKALGSALEKLLAADEAPGSNDE